MCDTTLIADWRKMGHTRLKPHSMQANLEVDVLLEAVLGLSRAQLFTLDNQTLTRQQLATLNSGLARLENGEPLAYVLGQQEFWSLTLSVSPDVLIPRPDTELLVETALEHLAPIPSARVLELGTGSGAIALALASSRPTDTIVATDISSCALNVARTNQKNLTDAHPQMENISFVLSDWYEHVDTRPFDLIVSNPPYIDASDPHVDSSVRRYEPESALFCGNQGLEDIESIINGSAVFLNSGGRILLEHGWQQHRSVSQCFARHGFVKIRSFQDLAGHYRVTGATLKET